MTFLWILGNYNQFFTVFQWVYIDWEDCGKSITTTLDLSGSCTKSLIKGMWKNILELNMFQLYKDYLYYNYEKYPLSPLKPRSLALLSWHVPYNWGSGNLVHQHLHDSCPLTDVNPHFTAPGCRYYFKRWHIVTSLTHGPAASYCDVIMAHCSHRYLWTHDVEVGASWRDCNNLQSPELFGTWLHYFAYHGRMIHYGTLGDQTIYTRFGLICLFTFIFGLLCFNMGHR